jgi:ketosteroid isomerase-like protein
MTDSVKEQVGDLVSRAKRRVGVEQPSAADDDGRVGVVRGALQTFGEGDTDGFLDALRHDVVWEGPSGGHFPGGGEQLGRDAVKTEFVDNCERTFTAFGFKPETFVDADDTDAVIVIGRYEGNGVEGARLDEPAVQIWEFQGKAVARVRIFTDSAGFPPVITERREQEMEEQEREEKEKEEKEQQEKEEAKAEKDGDDKSETDDETKGEAKSEQSDETKGETSDQATAEKSDDTEASSERDESGNSDSDDERNKDG